MVAMTQLVADDHPGRVGAWTLRDIAAHLATTEKECFEPRIRAMAAGERPEFEFYSNDDRDFEGISLESALTAWACTPSLESSRSTAICRSRSTTTGTTCGASSAWRPKPRARLGGESPRLV